MKKKIVLIISFLTIALTFENCATCDDCEVSAAAKQIVVINKDGENLIFGTKAIYDLKSIEIKNKAGEILDFLPNDISGSLDFAFNRSYDQYYIKLNSKDTDTLGFKFGKDKHVDCCKEFDVTTSTSVNGKSVINTDKITIIK